MDKARSGGLGRLGATVVARRCRRGGVACKSLDHGKIGTGIKGRRHERSAQIVRRAPRDSGFLGTLAQASHERVRGDAATGINRAGLRHRSEDRAGHGDPAVCQPRIEGCPCTAGRIDDALAVALADDAHGAGVRFVVGNLHGHRFGAAQAAAKEQGEGSRVAGAGRGAVGTDGKQRPDLGGFEGPAGRQTRTANGRHVDRPVIAIGGHQIQAPGGPQDTADGGERLVRRGGRVALGQHGAQGRNVMMAQFLPGAGRGIAETEHGGELGERRGHRAPPLTGRQARKIDGRRIALRRESLGGGNRQNGHGSSRLPGTCILDQVSRPSGNGAGNKLTALAAVVALSGGLAACGGSGSSNAGAQATTTSSQPTPSQSKIPSIAALFAEAHTVESDAMDAAMAAKDAVEDAKEAAEKVEMAMRIEAAGGDSGVAMMNAQAVINARDRANKAVMDAKAALDKARMAQTTAMEHHSDNVALLEALKDAVDTATEQHEKAMEEAGGDALSDAVDEVTGGKDMDPQGSPRSVANDVGMAIASALARSNTGGGTRVTLVPDVSAPPDISSVPSSLKLKTDDHKGMTWAQIVGEDKIKSERIGADNSIRMIALVADMPAEDVNPLGDDLSNAGGNDSDGMYSDAFVTDATDINYKGIPGTVWCLGGNDGCSVKDGKLVGSWYFSPTSPEAFYQKSDDDPNMYVPEILYASFGHWLTKSNNEDWTLSIFATRGAENTPTAYNLAAADDVNMFDDKNTATYSGHAEGMSVHKMGSDDSETTDSARFTADVSLTAKFDNTNSTVSGTIDNFDGAAVGEGWVVKLDSVALAPDGELTQGGVTTSSGRDGTWTNAAYGPAGARPAGIYGGFVSHFSDGNAAGAYATRIDAD